MMERYSFQKIESKWRSNIIANSVKNKDSKKKILLFGNVSLSFRQNPYGPCSKLYNWRCGS
jgi:hypothetical protein